MKIFLKRWLLPPRFDDEYKNFAYQALHYTQVILIGVVTLIMVIGASSYYWSVGTVTLSLLVACYLLIHFKRAGIASVLFLGGLWSLITLVMFFQNGVFNSSLIGYLLIIIYAAILFSIRAVIFFTALCSTTVIVIGYLQLNMLLPDNTVILAAQDRILISIAVFSATGILLAEATRVIQYSLRRRDESEISLQERNRQLEQEIEERHRIEASLRASEENYRLLFENTSIWTGVYDYDGRVLMMNQAAASVFGNTPEGMKGKTVFDMFDDKDASAALRRQQRVIDTGIADVFEGTIQLPTGKEIYYLRHIIPIQEASSEDDDTHKPPPLKNVLVLTTDLTEQKLAEQRALELAAMQEKNAFFTDFFGTISHDIKTPLSVINTSLYLLEHSQDPERRTVKLAQIKEQLSLLEQYIQDMLMISRLEHVPTFKKSQLNLNQLIEEITPLLLPRCEKKQIKCLIHLQDNLNQLVADRDQLRRAIINLIENAINYTPNNGEITISTAASTAQIVLKIEDTGIGIKPEDIPHIFERFYRAPEARTQEYSGTGLGLAIVKKIVDMHDGDITVSSIPNRGSTFEIHLPYQLQPV